MNRYQSAISQAAHQSVPMNKVLKNTYMLLSATLIWSAVLASVSMALSPPPFISLLTSIGALVLLWFVLPRTADTSAGLGMVFLITGLLGFGLGPTLNFYAAIPNGGQIIATAFGGTGLIFIGLSAYALTSQRDFSFLGGFLFIGLMVVLVASLVGIFVQMPALQLTISAAVVLLMSGLILFETSQIIRGGETNYIMATVSLYLSIINLFQALLHLLGAFGGGNND
jgi:modulator of FtsH protease